MFGMDKCLYKYDINTLARFDFVPCMRRERP